jgi:hypothetical protein
MAAKKRQPAKRAKPAAKDWPAIAQGLAARVLWALKFMHTRSPGGLVCSADGVSQAWDDWFADALDAYGYVIDRKVLHARHAAPKKRRAPVHGPMPRGGR